MSWQQWNAIDKSEQLNINNIYSWTNKEKQKIFMQQTRGAYFMHKLSECFFMEMSDDAKDFSMSKKNNYNHFVDNKKKHVCS